LTGKAGVALLYLFIGDEAKKNGGLLATEPDDESADLNRVDFKSKGKKQTNGDTVRTSDIFKPEKLALFVYIVSTC